MPKKTIKRIHLSMRITVEAHRWIEQLRASWSVGSDRLNDRQVIERALFTARVQDELQADARPKPASK